MALEEDVLVKNLDELQRKLNKKQSFEDAVSSIQDIFLKSYSSSSPLIQSKIYSVVCRVATVLQTRYTATGFWLVGLSLFEDAERLVTKASEKGHLRACIARARGHLHDSENQPDVEGHTRNNASSRYLFEGHLTVGAEPPPPAWLVAQNFLTTLAAAEGLNGAGAASSRGLDESHNASEPMARVNDLLQELVNNMPVLENVHDLETAIEASLQEIGAGPEKVPPASKEVVAKLPIINITDDVIASLGSETECAVCRENLVINDEMQEMPCKHLFHPGCLKPWLDEHNSCPICRHELRTDDHAYESRKEREKEEEEERKGADNAIRGGEYMYV